MTFSSSKCGGLLSGCAVTPRSLAALGSHPGRCSALCCSLRSHHPPHSPKEGLLLPLPTPGFAPGAVSYPGAFSAAEYKTKIALVQKCEQSPEDEGLSDCSWCSPICECPWGLCVGLVWHVGPEGSPKLLVHPNQRCFSVNRKVQTAGGCGCSPSIIPSPVIFPSSSLFRFLQSISSG